MLVREVTVLGRGDGVLLGFIVLAEGVMLRGLVMVVRGGMMVRGGLVMLGGSGVLHRLNHDWNFLKNPQ